MLALLLMGYAGCSTPPEKPDNPIPDSTYVDLLVELQLIRSFAENTNTDSATVDSLASEVYEKYGITEKQFQLNHRYYERFPEAQKKRVGRAIEQLKMELVTSQDTTETSPDDSIKTK